MADLITYQVEPWADYHRDCEWLWPLHYDELALDQGKVLMAPDIEEYAALDAAGKLHIVTVRRNGVLVGYHISVVRTALHNRHSLFAYGDSYFLHPDVRQGMVGIRLFREAERTLKARGVHKMTAATKLHLDMSPIFRRLGWTEAERVFTKYIGGD